MTATATQDFLRLPRDRWEAHPNYPRQVLLLGSHDAFRQVSRVLIERAEGSGDVAGIAWVFEYWKGGMSGHEHYEEGKLYPYLEARWGLSCDALRDGHEALGALDERVRRAVEADDREALKAALRAHDRVLNEHLDAEEGLVIPALLALAPAEFDAYYHGDIDTLLADLAG